MKNYYIYKQEQNLTNGNIDPLEFVTTILADSYIDAKSYIETEYTAHVHENTCVIYYLLDNDYLPFRQINKSFYDNYIKCCLNNGKTLKEIENMLYDLAIYVDLDFE